MNRTKQYLLLSVGIAALITPAVSRAQATDGASKAATVDEVVITGIRASLKSAQTLKRDAGQIVDAVVAEDVGKFPDGNIAEALQRVAGVSIDRSGGEGKFVTVRGLGAGFTAVTINGRTMANESAGREFSFDTLSATLIQRSEVFKTSTPNLTEGGIGGTVNVITSRPLEGGDGARFNLQGSGIYDVQGKVFSPDLSGAFNWKSSDGQHGLALSASYYNRDSRPDSQIVYSWRPLVETDVINAPSTARNLPGSARGTNPNKVVGQIPLYFDFAREFFNHKRTNFGAVYQFRPSDAWLLTVDGIYSDYDYRQDQFRADSFTYPDFLAPTVNGNGTVTSFGMAGTDFAVANPLVGARSGISPTGIEFDTQNTTSTYLVGANLLWTPNDQFRLAFDASTTEATRNTQVLLGVLTSTSASSPQVGVKSNGTITYDQLSAAAFDPANQRAGYQGFDRTRIHDEGREFRVDGSYFTDEDFLKRIDFGALYSSRQKSKEFYNNYSVACTYCGATLAMDPSLVQKVSLDGWLSAGNPGGHPLAALVPSDDSAAFLNNRNNLALGLRTNDPTLSSAAALARADQIKAGGGIFSLTQDLGATTVVLEEVSALYFNTNWELGPLTANAGLRYVHTNTTSSGYAAALQSIGVTPGPTDGLIFNFAPPTSIRETNSYSNILQSLNVKYQLNESMNLRFAASNTISRPTLQSLGTDNSYSGRVTQAVSSGGNPNLKPLESRNYDLSWEWYPSSLNYVSVTLFQKEFTNFLEVSTLPITRFGYVFSDTRTRNGSSGSVSGLEIGGTYAFDDSRGWLSGFGVNGSYTRVESQTLRSSSSGLQASCGYPGLSPNNYSGAVFYEKHGISARVAYTLRDEYLVACNGAGGVAQYHESYGQLDASASYDVTENFQVFVQGVNLTNDRQYDYSIYKERAIYQAHDGTRVNVGVRAKF